MPRTKISEFSVTPGDNTDIDGINIAEGCAPSGINDAIRELMAQLKDFQSGAAGDSITVVGTLAAKGTSSSGADLKLYEDTDNGTNYVGFIAPASIASNVQWTLPSADGSSGQALQTNGSGTLSFATLGISAGGTGQTTANAAFNALAPSQTSNAGRYLKTDGTNTSWDLLDISTADITGTLPVANGGTGLTSFTANGVLYASSTSALTTGSALTFDGSNLQIGSQGDLRLGDADNSNWVAFQAPATVASNVTWTLPSADGTNGQALTTNGSGTLAFATISASPGGSTTQVQYNNAGAFAGSANFTFDGTNIAVASRTFGRGAATSGGVNNVAAGQNALSSNTTGEFSIAMGYNALTAQTTGSSNTGLGNSALAAVVSGNNNTGVGRNAFASTTASDNTGVGYFAGLNTTTGANNTAVGSGALQANTTTGNLTAVGYQALTANTSGDRNTALGYQALKANTTGGQNTAVGKDALVDCTTGARNTAVGNETMIALTTGNNNVSMGVDSLRALTTGNYNTSIGDQALRYVTTASNNNALGYLSLFNNTGGSNNAFGTSALYSNTSGVNNVAMGHEALYANTTASDNTAIGAYCLDSNTTGAGNSSLGRDALQANTTGNYNTGVGRSALASNTTADLSTALGYQALIVSTGAQNTGIGANALDSVTTGTNNVGVGYLAGAAITTGSTNIAIGKENLQSLTTGSYNVHVGFATTAGAAGRNFAIVISSDDDGSTDKGDSTGFINANAGGVYQGNNSSSWSTTSDFRLKKNIVDNNEGLEKIAAIRVRNFEYRLPEEVDPALKPSDAIKRPGVQLGVIAQELQQVCPDCVKEESTGVLSVDSDNVFWHMVNAIKQLKSELDSVKAELATLKGA